MGKGATFGAGGLAGLLIGIVLGGMYLNIAHGTGLNMGDPFVLVTQFPGWRGAVLDPWRAAFGIVIGAALLVGLGAVLFGMGARLTQYGQARWQDRADLKRNGLLQPVGTGLVFGKLGRPGSAKAFIAATYDKFPHALVVAPTRAGKGVGYVIPNCLLFPGSLVVLDVKGEIFEATSRHRQARGDQVFRFAPFDFEHPTRRYNPLARIAKLASVDQRFTELSKLASYFLTVSDRGSAQDFLENGRQLFVAASLYAIEQKKPSIGDVLKIITGGEKKSKAYAAVAKTTQIGVVKRIFTDFGSMNERTLTSTISVLLGAGLNLWNNPAVAKATSASDFDFSSLRSRPQSIYVVVNSDDIKPLAPLIRLLFGELIATLRASLPDPETEPWPVMIMLDEFDQLGAMPIVVQSLKQLAGHGARVSIITQSIPGLDKIYDENDRLSIESSAGMKLYLSANDKKTANEVSESLGKTTKLSVSDSYAQDHPLARKRSISRRNEERPLLTPDEVRRLSSDQVILVPERQNPILARRVVYYQDPVFMKVYRAQSGPYPFPELVEENGPGGGSVGEGVDVENRPVLAKIRIGSRATASAVRNDETRALSGLRQDASGNLFGWGEGKDRSVESGQVEAMERAQDVLGRVVKGRDSED